MPKPLSTETPIELHLHLASKDDIYLWPDKNHPDYQENKDGTTDAPLQDELSGPAIDQDVCSMFFISAYTDHGTSLVTCYGWHIDESSDYYIDDESMLTYADEQDGDALEAFDILQKWKKYISFEDEECPPICPCCIYISRLFVNPDYRQKHLASIILKNLDRLFDKYMQTLRYAVTIINPDTPPEGMTKKQMETIMIKTLRKAGFVKIGTTDDEKHHPVFAKHYHP